MIDVVLAGRMEVGEVRDNGVRDWIFEGRGRLDFSDPSRVEAEVREEGGLLCRGIDGVVVRETRLG